MNNFKDRLKMVVKGESVRAFADRAGLTEGVIRKYLIGPTLPGLENLIAIATAAKVNIKWLATGVGPMSINDSERVDIGFLEFLLEIYEQYEKELGKNFSFGEKAWSISTIYNSFWRTYYKDRSDFVDHGSLIRLSIESLHEAFCQANKIMKSSTDSKEADKEIRDIFNLYWGDDTGEDAAGTLLRSHLLDHASKK